MTLYYYEYFYEEVSSLDNTVLGFNFINKV